MLVVYNELMFTDVAELREFYSSPLGQLAQRWLRRRVRTLWPSLRGQTVLALGYATPLLSPWLDEAERVIAFMPGAQGVVHWPREAPNRTALVEETALPLLDASVDRVILLHLVECAPHLDLMMQEIWRVLRSGGRLMTIAPNRSGFWAQSDATPFGHSSAFSASQLKALLRRHYFIPEQQSRALFFPPSAAAFWMGTAALWERIGPRWLSPFAGVHLIEADKQLYAPTGKRMPAQSYAPVRARPITANASVNLRER